MKPVEFIELISDGAIEFMLETNIFASVTIAQSCLETGYGKHMPVDINTGKVSNNIFGVKYRGYGDYVLSPTWEVINGETIHINAKFQAYDSIYESLEDRGKLVGYAPRYAPVRSAKTAEEQARQLYLCGYATDPNYASKIISIINTQNLKRFDSEGLKMKETILQMQMEISNLKVEVAKLKEMNAMKEIPEWAKNAIEKAVENKLISNPENSSYDFYRLVTIFDRAGIFDKS